MKRFYYIISAIFFLTFYVQPAFSQCTPLDAEACPDPENNGEICPDTLAPVYVGVEYSQVATVLAPPKIDTGSITLPLHHITLVSVDNLPKGITWVTNAVDNEFMVGTYYCILLSGTSTAEVGSYTLKIVVDVYADYNSIPIYLGQSVDSTSLSIDVKWDPNGIPDKKANNMISKIWPNPFSSLINVELAGETEGKIGFGLYNMMGNRLYHEEVSNLISTTIRMNLPGLSNGVYMLILEYRGKRYLQMVTKYD